MPPDCRLLRSWLFVPADSERKLQRVWNAGADAVIVDLEDAVAPERKVEARAIATSAIRDTPRHDTFVTVRINALDSGLAWDDLEATFPARPDAYMVPKVGSPDEIVTVADRLGKLEAAAGLPAGTVRLVPIVTEHPRAVLRLEALCSVHPRTAAVLWGSEDLSAAIGARRVKRDDGTMFDVFRVVRALTLIAASAAGIGVLDTPVVEIEDLDALSREAAEAAAMGFTGKIAIHPKQVGPINRAFLPDEAAVEHARGLLDAAAVQGGSGTFRYRGKMIDAPHVKVAERIVALAATHARRITPVRE